MVQDEEERKQRYERARMLSNSISNNSNLNPNFNNIVLNNYQGKTEQEKEYISKFQRARELSNSINPRKEETILEPTEEEREESRRNAQELLNLMDNGIQEPEQEEQQVQSISNTIEDNQKENTATPQQRAAVDIIMNKKTIDEVKQGNEQNATDTSEETTNNGNILTSIKGILENLFLGGSSGVKQTLKYVETANEQNFDNYENIRERQYLASPNVSMEDKTNQRQSNNLLINNNERLQLVSQNVKDYGTLTNPLYNTEEQETNLVKKGLQDSIEQDTLKMQENINNTTGAITRKLAELAPSIGQMTVGWGASAVNPMLGVSYFLTSAGGSYIDDAKDRGMNDDQAFTYGTIMGAMESATEQIGMSKLMKGGKALASGAIREALKNYGLNATDNFIQEAIIEPISEITAYFVGGPETVNWDNIGERMLQSGIDGALTALIMDGASAGINSSIRLVDKIRNNENISQTEIKNAIEDISNNENINVEDTIRNEMDYQIQNASNTDNYIVARYNNENDNLELYDVKGEPININKDELNITPAVVKIEGFYNVIDSNSGLELYTTRNTDKQDTIAEFQERITNLDKAGMQNINNQVTKTKLAVANKLLEIQGNPQALENFQVQQSQNVVNNNNYTMSIQNNDERNINPNVRDLRMAIEQIQDSSYYNSKNTIEIMKTISDNFDNVTYTQNKLTVKNAKGNTMYSKDIRNNIGYSGKSIKNILSNVYNYVMNDSSNVNDTQTSSEQNIDNSSSSITNYAVQDINKVTEPFSKQNSYTRDEMAEIWNNEIDSNSYGIYYDDDGNIERYIAIEEEGNNIVVNQYDNSDNIVKSESIPSIDGKYKASDIQDTINRVASLYDENRPIKGQRDIEGNEVKSMKKKSSKTTLSDEQIRDIVKYNPDGKEIRDTDYVDFMVERFKDKRNISNIKTTSTEVNTLLNETLKEAKNKVGTNEANKIRNKQKELMIDKLYSKIKDKKFQVTKKLKGENGNIETKDLNIEISKNGLKESFNKSISNEKYAVVPFLDKLIQTSNSGIIRNETKLRQNIDEWYYLYNTAIVDNQLYGVKIDIKKTGQGDRFYVHRLNIIKEGTSSSESIFRDDTIRNNKIPSSTNSISQSINIIKSIENFKKAKNTIARQDIINVATTLNVYHRGETFIDDNMSKRSGNNTRTKIIKVDNYFTEFTDKEDLRKQAYNYAMENHKNARVEIKDIKMEIDVPQRGIKKTFGKNQDNNKMQTAPKLLDIIRESVYRDSSISTKNSSLKYHYFYAPISIDNNNNKIALITIKEDTTNTNENNKFYYHDIREFDDINNMKEGKAHAMPHKNVSNMLFEQFPPSFINNSIPQKSNSVKNTATNQSMQNNKNNALELQKIQKELHNRIANALLSKKTKKNTYLGQVTDKVAKKVKSLLGIDITGRKHIIPDYNIRHIINQHGNPEIERTKGQLAVTRKDIERIPEILSTYDSIEKGSINTNSITSSYNQSIRYIKKYNNNTTYVVEVVPKTGKTLEIKTMWKKPITLTNSKSTPSSTSKTRGNNVKSTLKNEPAGLSHGNNTPPYTSETKSSLGSTNSIAQNSQNVKDDGIRTMRKNSSNTTNNNTEKIRFEKVAKTVNIKYNSNGITLGKREYANVLSLINTNNTNKKGLHYINSSNYFYLYYNNGFGNNTIIAKIPIEGNEDLLKFVREGLNNGVYTKPTSVIKDVKEYKNGRRSNNNNNDSSTRTRENGEITRLHSGNVGQETRARQGQNNDKSTRTKSRITHTQFIKKSAKQNNLDNGIRAERTENSNNTNPFDERKYEKNKDFMNYLKENSYLQSIMKVDTTKGETYAHSSDRLLEQEIRKATSEGKLDKNIPVTKITDIDADIEIYLGKTIGKGHFRERARGIYNQNTDRVSVKEYKDLDNIFHELGHALDLGNRIKVDKASLSDELLLATKRHGGYEGDTIGVQLDEGFAEILKTYAINKDIVKSDYPKSFKVLEEFKISNTSFGKFITKLQQDTYNYIHQTDINKVMSNISIGEKSRNKLTREEIKDKLIYWFLDDNQYVKSASRKLAKASGRKFEELKPSENPYLLLRLLNGTQSKALSMITDGYINLDGEIAFQGLSKLNNILGENAENWNNFRAYITALRDLEYKNSNYKTGIRTISSKSVVEQLYNNKAIQEATKILQENTKGFLQYAVDNHLIDSETADTLQQNNVFYVPFYRDMQDISKSNINNKSNFDSLFKKRTGSELDIKDPLENVIVNAANIVQAVETNNVLNAFYKLGKSAGSMNDIFKEIPAPMIKVSTQQLAMWENDLQSQGVDTTALDLEKTADIFAPNNKIDTANRVVSFIDENGTRRYLQFDKSAVDIFNTLLGIDKETSNVIFDAFAKLNTPLRYGATAWNPSFYVSNMQADAQQAFVYSDETFIPIVDNIKGVVNFASTYDRGAGKIAEAINAEYAGEQERMLQLYKQSGASSATRLSQERKSIQKTMSEVYGVKDSETLGIRNRYKAVKKVADLFNTAGDVSEQSTRFRVFDENYNKYIQEGWSEIDARIKSALEARDATQDFSRMGSFMRKYINKAIPFSGARVGSLLTFKEKITTKPKQTAMRIAIVGAVSLAFKALSSDDDEIDEINQRKKDDYYILRLGDTIITLKKPQGLLKSLINLDELVFDLVTGKVEEDKVDDRIINWISNTLKDSSITDNITGTVPSFLATILENVMNKDFYYNTEIVKSYDEQNLPERQQYYEYNSQIAILLGQIFNYSPAKIDNTISGWFGGMGTEITNIVDYILGKLGFSAEKPEMGAEDTMILKRFVINPSENSSSVDEIYTLKSDLTKKTKDDRISEEEKSKAEEQLKKIEEATSNMAKLNKQIKEIKKSLTMSGEEKAEQIKLLQQQKTDTARTALGKEVLYSENETNIESTTFYPSQDTLSQNGYTLNLTSDMKKEYEELAYNKYKQYEKQGIYSEEKLEKIREKCKDYAKSQLLKKYKNDLIKKNE